MSVILRILAKDCRRLGAVFAVAAAIGLVAQCLPFWGIDLADRRVTEPLPLIFGIYALTIGLAVAGLIHADPPTGEKADWRIRPMGTAQVLAAKLVFIIGAGVLPYAAVIAAVAWRMGAPWEIGFPLVAEVAAHALMWLLGWALIGAFSESLLGTLLIFLALVAGLAVVRLGFHQSSVGRVEDFYFARSLLWSAAFVGLLALRYRAPRPKMLLLGGAIAAALVFGFGRILPAHPAAGRLDQLPAGPNGNLAAVVDGHAFLAGTQSSAEANPVSVAARVAFSGARPGHSFVPLAVKSSFYPTNGPALSMGTFARAVAEFDRIPKEAVAAALGDEKAARGPDDFACTVLDLSPGQYSTWGGATGRLESTFDLGEVGARQIARLALQPGAQSSSPGCLWRVRSVHESAGSGMRIDLDCLTLNRAARPWIFALVSRNRGQYELQRDGNWAGTYFATGILQGGVRTLEYSHWKGAPPAGLCIVETRIEDTVTVRTSSDAFRLPRAGGVL